MSPRLPLLLLWHALPDPEAGIAAAWLASAVPEARGPAVTVGLTCLRGWSCCCVLALPVPETRDAAVVADLPAPEAGLLLWWLALLGPENGVAAILTCPQDWSRLMVTGLTCPQGRSCCCGRLTCPRGWCCSGGRPNLSPRLEYLLSWLVLPVPALLNGQSHFTLDRIDGADANMSYCKIYS
jgi:hypothetical protein